MKSAKSVFKDLLQISAKWNEIGSRLGLAVAGSGRICADSGEEEDDEAFIEKVKHLDKDISVEEIALEDITEVKAAAPPPPPAPLPPPGPFPTPRDSTRDLLNKIELKARSIIKKSKEKGELELEETDADTSVEKLEPDVQKWAEIQSRKRDKSIAEFMSLVKEERAKLEACLEELEKDTPASLEEISKVLDILQEGPQWFSGGNKEMKKILPKYEKLENKVETMNEYKKVDEETRKAVGESVPTECDIPYVDLKKTLDQVGGDFNKKHERWGKIILSNAPSWVKYDLPVCHTLFKKSRDHLCALINRYVSICLKEAPKLTGNLVSSKSTRTTEAKEKLKECLEFLLESHPYFTLKVAKGTCQCEGCVSDSDLPDTHDESATVLFLSVQVTVAYVELALRQFDGYVCDSHRQTVCDHFEGILKMVNIIKSLVLGVSGEKLQLIKKKKAAFVTFLPGGDKLGELLVSSCETLFNHAYADSIDSEKSALKENKQAKDMASWMIYGCKYLGQILDFRGCNPNDSKSTKAVLTKVTEMKSYLGL